MKRAILAAAMMAAVGCGGAPSGNCGRAPWDEGTPVPEQELVAFGTPAPHTDMVLAVAQTYCGRPIVGRLVWADHSLDGEHDGQSVVQGRACPLDAWVLYRHNLQTAWDSPLAHEIGHWCLQTANEDLAEGWAAKVNGEAMRSL